MINEDTGEVTTDGTIEQYGSHRAVDTATETEDHAILTNLSLQLGHGRIDERCSTPLLAGAADIDHEVL